MAQPGRGRRRLLRAGAAAWALPLGAALVLGCDSGRPPAPRPDPTPSPVPSSAPPPSAVPLSTPSAPPWSPPPLEETLAPLRARHPALFDDPDDHRLQLVLRWVHGDRVVRQGFRVDAEYVYPASAIKPVAAVAALHAVRARWGNAVAPGGRGVTLERCLDPRCVDRAGEADLGETIEVTLRDSDNAGLGWLFDLVGRESLHHWRWRGGLPSLRFHHRMGETSEQGRRSPPLAVRHGTDTFLQPERTAPALPAHDVTGTDVGRRHQRGSVVLDGPMSFADKNYVALDELQQLLVAIVRPDLAPAIELGIHAEDRRFLIEVMSAEPTVPGAHRPLAPGIERVPGAGDLRHVGKAGRAYGFSIVNAYLGAGDEGVFVTATVYTDPDGVVNDDAYAYARKALPFFADLGETLANVLLESPAKDGPQSRDEPGPAGPTKKKPAIPNPK